MSACSGYRRKPGQTVDTVWGDCMHGFVVTPACINESIAARLRPMCCMTDIPKHWHSVLDDSGKPRQRKSA